MCLLMVYWFSSSAKRMKEAFAFSKQYISLWPSLGMRSPLGAHSVLDTFPLFVCFLQIELEAILGLNQDLLPPLDENGQIIPNKLSKVRLSPASVNRRKELAARRKLSSPGSQHALT